jgi:NADP-dependent 3-hydroxy acid dehydrogenase YdfG
VNAGANVIAVDRNVNNLKTSSRLYPYQLDVTDSQALKQMYHDVLSKYGRIDGVCNNAGLFERTISLYLIVDKSKGRTFLG